MTPMTLFENILADPNMFFTTSSQAELATRINCDLAVMTVLWLLSPTSETSSLDSCSKTCISVHKLLKKTYFTLILYTVAFCQLFIKYYDGWFRWIDDGWTSRLASVNGHFDRLPSHYWTSRSPGQTLRDKLFAVLRQLSGTRCLRQSALTHCLYLNLGLRRTSSIRLLSNTHDWPAASASEAKAL